MLKNLKLTAKMMLSIGTVVILSFIVSAGFITNKATSLSRQEAVEKMNALAGQYSNEIRVDIENAFDTARALSYSIANMKQTGNMAKREQILSMMEGMLKKNEGYLGIWTVDRKSTRLNSSHYS